VTPGYGVRLDPWAADYDGALQLLDLEDEVDAPVDTAVETGDWRPLRPDPAPRLPAVAFVDGVRRVEHRLLLEGGGPAVFGLLGSYAVGATLVDGRARVAREQVQRVACVGGGLALSRLDAPVPGGRQTLAFEPQSTPENTPMAPMQCLQTTMRRGEAALAEELAADGAVVFLDGPLTFVAASARPVIGFVKRLLKPYLPAAEAAVLRLLAAGERTPLFLIEAQSPRYSWYLRLAAGRPIDSTLAGIVRLETAGALGLSAARELADASARELPRFASSAARDPRAPQNLYPIGGLEVALRHLLGDHLVVRRAIEARLFGAAWSEQGARTRGG
jgi:hypothetical protein